MIPDWMGGSNAARSATTPRAGKRITGAGDQTVHISSIGAAKGKGLLMSSPQTWGDNGVSSLGTVETVVGDKWGRKKVEARSGFGTSDLTKPVPLRVRRPGPHCGTHATHDRNNIGDYFVSKPERHHEFKLEKRILSNKTELPDRARGGDPMSTRTNHLQQFVVSPEPQRRHLESKNQNGLLRNAPRESQQENLRERVARTLTRRHNPSVPHTGSSPHIRAAGQDSSLVSHTRTRSGRRGPTSMTDSPGRSRIAEQCFSGGHAPAKREPIVTKIGATPWVR